ncbi:MAG: hypothetical protein IKJ35_01425 [Clostridia bacterium]|nr:hypothetical protein [Clostridia bacterium]
MPFIGFPKAELYTADAATHAVDLPEQLVLRAIAQGMTCIGFSAHSRISFLPERGMSIEEEQGYRAEIARLRRLYGDRIHIFFGVNQDYCADLPPLGYDFVVGSVDYIRSGDAYCAASESLRLLHGMIDRHFASDAFAFLRAYFEAFANLPEKTACDIVAVPDAALRWNGEDSLFDGRNVRYRKCVLDALDALLEKNVIFEIDTRNFLADVRRSSRAYLMLLRYLAENRGRVTLTSSVEDFARTKQELAQAEHLCRSVGIGSVSRLTASGWQSVGL